MNQITIRRALLSLSEKSQLSGLLAGLSAFPIELYSTGGTYAAIDQWLLSNPCALSLIRLEDYLDYPEMPGGLVKTLHPRVHGGLLANLTDPAQVEHMQQQRMHPFDLLAVNLYPFEQQNSIQNIDIGGVAMLRAGAKNFSRVAVLTNPADYPPVCAEMAQNRGALSSATRLRLAQVAFRHVLSYDRAISLYFDTLEEVPC
jgi:phosphoribosylaminoimidazolecarboxamide formyltransferase/IMP cyclohydrolase